MDQERSPPPWLRGRRPRVGPEPIVVLARARGEADLWDGRFAVSLPESRMAAQAALAGRSPRGALGAALAELADLIGAGR
jgi:hypothetical protein